MNAIIGTWKKASIIIEINTGTLSNKERLMITINLTIFKS